jgi:hypothetical protein
MLSLVAWILWLKPLADGAVNSLILSKPKNAREKAAASIRLSCPFKDRAALILAKSLLRIGPVIGCLREGVALA